MLDEQAERVAVLLERLRPDRDDEILLVLLRGKTVGLVHLLLRKETAGLGSGLAVAVFPGVESGVESGNELVVARAAENAAAAVS